MSNPFFEKPILNSPYARPERHWEMDDQGQPTQQILSKRRPASYITPIPRSKKQVAAATRQTALDFDETGLSTDEQAYDPNPLIIQLRERLDDWRALPNQATWGVTPETARLLRHWRHHKFAGVRPFFCQVEAVETVIWLTEVAPHARDGAAFLAHLKNASDQANPGLLRLALKLATGAGKTTVMAMVIAWQTVNAVRRPSSKRFTRGFLIVAPGITIRDRLRVLFPNDPDSYYKNRELLPPDMLPDLGKARIVITNYHAFKLRSTLELSPTSAALLQGRTGPPPETLETEGAMLRRVAPELMGLGGAGVYVINDEAHHCYRHRPQGDVEQPLTAEEKAEAEKNEKAARLWISGLEAAQRKLGLARVLDLSATPFFLRGSGYREGTLFPWTLSDFSLMDAIECGIVKLPRVPVADNLPDADVPRFRNLWEHIRHKMPRKGRGKGGELDPRKIPMELQTALEALYGHYARTFEHWERQRCAVPPCFIVVCNNTAASKLVHDYISGFFGLNDLGVTELIPGKFPLFRNYDEHGAPLARPRTLLIDSEQLEAGDALDSAFREMAADEIDRFRRDMADRTGNARTAEQFSEGELLREVLNTVGKPGMLGSSVRCVVSVSMLTEGWDANTVTHVLGVRAFGTQLLCEQVVGRALRRWSYELNDEGLFGAEYADVLGIPFDFTAGPTPTVDPVPAPPPVRVKAVRPDRDALEIRFPRVQGYGVQLPEERLRADFTEASAMELSPEVIGPTRTHNAGIVGQTSDLTLQHTASTRLSDVSFALTERLIDIHYRDAEQRPKAHLFVMLKPLVLRWLNERLTCVGGTYPAQLLYQELADQACERITAAITAAHREERPVVALLDPYNPEGSTNFVSFTTRKPTWETRHDRCHLNLAVIDSDWEAEFCRIAEAHPHVLAYVKNQNLGLEVPYTFRAQRRGYVPDFVVLVDDGRGLDDPLHLVVEVKGAEDGVTQAKKQTMETFWVPGVNALRRFGRWDYVQMTDVLAMDAEFSALLAEARRKWAPAGGA
ncbi:MAG: DEAD/DEAH box helicase family protein [Armatimonadetes bacterium]|nr:DEAD/DEAH box helicase family protein [Armatimonadota bacterium]